AAALAAQRLGAFAGKIDGVESRYEIVGDTDHNSRLAVGTDADDGDHAGAKLFLAVVGEAAQILQLDSLDRPRHQFDAADLAHAVGAVAGFTAGTATHCELLLRLGEVTLEPLAFVHQCADAGRQFVNCGP